MHQKALKPNLKSEKILSYKFKEEFQQAVCTLTASQFSQSD